MDEKWVREVDLWKSQMEIVIPQLEKDTKQNMEDITVLQTNEKVAEATEDGRMRKAVAAVHKSGSYRLQQAAIILVALATIAGIIFGNAKHDIDSQAIIDAVVKAVGK